MDVRPYVRWRRAICVRLLMGRVNVVELDKLHPLMEVVSFKEVMPRMLSVKEVMESMLLLMVY